MIEQPAMQPGIELPFMAQGPQAFDENKIAPSLVGIEPGDEYSDPSESYLFDEEQREKEARKLKFGMNQAQLQKLKTRIQRDASEAIGFWTPHYGKMADDWKFFSADNLGMWEETAKAARKGRPMLQYPMITKFVDHNISETLRNPPGVKLSPREDGDVVKSRIGMDLVRYIEDRSGAKYAYSNAIRCSSVGGLGWIRVKFRLKKKKILVERVVDPLHYYLDPSSVALDGSDARFVVSKTLKTSNDKVTECYEYWWREEADDPEAEWEIYWAIVEGDDIVDYGHFPGEVIPIVPVFGDIIRWEDNLVVKGLVRDLADSQRTYNYLKSQEVETVSLTAKPPIRYAKGSIRKEKFGAWCNAAQKPNVPLEYVPFDDEGRPLNPPDYMPAKNDMQWMQGSATAAIADLKEVTGVYDTSLGSDTKELSGKAIIAKQLSTDSLQLKYTEHLECSLQQVGRCIIGLIMPVMGTQRVIRVLGENGKFGTVDLDRPYGMEEPIDLNFTEMDLSVSSGTAYATRRQNAVETFQNIMQAMPQTAAVIADLAVKNMDFDYAQEAADRLFKMLPPNLQGNGDAPKGYVPAAQLQMAVEMFEKARQAEEQIKQQLYARIQGLEAEVKNQIQGRVAQEQVKGEYNLANTQLKEFGQDRRKALEIQEKAEADGLKIQTTLMDKVYEQAAAVPRVVSDRAQRMVSEPQPQGAPQTGLQTRFESPTLGEGNMSQQDMLLNL